MNSLALLDRILLTMLGWKSEFYISRRINPTPKPEVGAFLLRKDEGQSIQEILPLFVSFTWRTYVTGTFMTTDEILNFTIITGGYI